MNCVIGYQDHLRAKKRRIDRFYAEEHAKEMARLAELMARLQRVPAIRAWNYVTSSISRAVSNLKPQSKLSKITYLLTSWQRRRVGDYGYFEAIDIMEEEKEYWEAFHKSWQGAWVWAKSGSSLKGGWVILHSWLPVYNTGTSIQKFNSNVNVAFSSPKLGQLHSKTDTVQQWVKDDERTSAWIIRRRKGKERRINNM